MTEMTDFLKIMRHKESCNLPRLMANERKILNKIA
jgi:hypothetical protein